MATRIQNSRPTKRPMVSKTWSTGGGAYTATTIHARVPKADKKGYPSDSYDSDGTPIPTLVEVTVVA